LDIFQAALRCVNGRTAVRHALTPEVPDSPFYLVAIGKAAESMALGVSDVCDELIRRGLIISKHGHIKSTFDKRFRCIESDHPVPGSASLRAGYELLAFCQSIPPGCEVLFCLSGGTSSLVEVLPENMALADVQRVNQVLLGSGLVIEQVNAIRCGFSLIKGGRLADVLRTRSARVFLISDVPGDDPAIIGSGPLYPFKNTDQPKWPQSLEGLRKRFSMPFPKAYPMIPHQIVANQKMALLAAESRAKERGYKVYLHSGFLEGETSAVAKYLSSYLQQAPAGVHLWGGETVVTLPENPGRGGRNQHLALQVAVHISGQKNIIFLAAGSDGTDGVTKDAGAMVDSESCTRGENAGLNAARMLRRFNAGSFFEASGDLVLTGPTGTNVMDFVMSIKQ